jgi:hypothetical protein
MHRFLALAFIISALALTPLRSSAILAEKRTTLADQRQLNVTVYNANLALVHDRRRLTLEKGENLVAWRDVSANLDGTSALLEDLTAPGSVSLIEQNFNFDLLSPEALLKKAVGSEVTVEHLGSLDGRPRREQAKLLSVNNGIVLQYADRVETDLSSSRIIYSSLPANLRDRPTLVLDFDSARAGDHELDLSYLTTGMNWHADYIGRVSPTEDRLDLSGLVTLTNNSGASYRDAHVQLVAGNVNVPPPTTQQFQTIGRVVSRSGDQVSQENFFEYHLYTLGHTTTIADNQTKQVGFMSARAIPVHKTLELRGSPSYYRNGSADLGDKIPVGVFVSFENKGGDLGIPLPGGVVRLYKSDSRGTSQFLGGDRIDHTPKNETVRLQVGASFDVTARRHQTNFRVIAQGVYESSFEIILSNAKDAAADVLVVEPIPGDWEMLTESQPHEKSSSSTASWLIHVPAGGSTKLSYTVRVRF